MFSFTSTRTVIPQELPACGGSSEDTLPAFEDLPGRLVSADLFVIFSIFTSYLYNIPGKSDLQMRKKEPVNKPAALEKKYS
jgi:hypothetical protein